MERRRLQILRNHISPPISNDVMILPEQLLQSESCNSERVDNIVFPEQSSTTEVTTFQKSPKRINPSPIVYHREQILDSIPNTSSLDDLRAYHSSTTQSLASRILREKEKHAFAKNGVRMREAAWRELSKDVYRIDNSWSVEEYRDHIYRQFLEFSKSGLVTVERVNTELWSFLGVLEALLPYDISFIAMVVVHYQLYGCCLYKLGSHRHKHLFKDANIARDIGCFAMTEVAHGSNVRGVGTTATFDPTTKQFVINTPNSESVKFWIGNSAEYGTKAVVFAQLTTKGKNHGVHAILCPLRDPDTGIITPGITIRDCGVKQGWNGVPNGAIRFDNVSVPRENLLNKYAEVDDQGNYTSPIKSEGKRFAETLSALMFGRLLYIMGPTKALEQCLTVAVRYAMQRRQFGSPNKVENLIWNYPTHKHKIMPLLASVHLFNSAWHSLAVEYENLTDATLNEFHAVISGVKAYVAEYVPQAILTLRPMCGGHGYSENNRIGRTMNDLDVFCTAEGDSNVLYQQLARHLITEYRHKFSSGNQLTSAAKFMYEKARVLLVEKNPLITRNTSESHLRDIKYHIQLFTARCSVLLHEAAMKLMENRKKTSDATDAWNATLQELVELSKSYVHLEMLKRFAHKIDHCEDAQVKKVFTILCNIYAVHNIAVCDSGFFRSNEFIKSGKVRAFKQLLPKLFAELDPLVPAIIDSFNIPDWLLMSPIGLSNMQYVSNTLERVGMPTNFD